MKIRINKRQGYYFVAILLLNVFGTFLLEALSNSINYIAVSRNSMIAIVIMALEYYLFAHLCDKAFPYYGIFLISFIVFHFGLFWVFSIGGDYNFFYFEQYGPKVLIRTIVYEFECVGALFLAGTFLPSIKPFKFRHMNSLDGIVVCSKANTIRIITGIVAYVLITIKLLYFISGYYSGVREFDSSVPSFVGLIEYFFIPFSVLTFIYSQNKQQKKRIIIVVIIWSLLTALCGDRTTGIAGIIIMYLLDVSDVKHSKTIRYLISIIVLSVAVFLIAFIRVFREGNGFTSFGVVSIINDVFGELGSSFFPLVLIMRICPFPHNYLFGRSYLYSFIAAFVPESIDFTGLITKWTYLSIEPINWITSDYQYTFGTGYSLCAESYANFGEFGFVVLFFIGLIIIKLLQIDPHNMFSLYCSTILMFEFFTLPRRNFYYVINHPFYCIVIVSVVILLLCNKKREV